MKGLALLLNKCFYLLPFYCSCNVTSIDSYIQEINVLLQKTKANGEKQSAFLKLMT